MWGRTFRCRECDGDGFVQVDCHECNGTGEGNIYDDYTQGYCRKCNGDGHENKCCPVCGGRGCVES